MATINKLWLLSDDEFDRAIRRAADYRSIYHRKTLHQKQQEIERLINAGYSAAEIARQLNIGETTVKRIRKAIQHK